MANIVVNKENSQILSFTRYGSDGEPITTPVDALYLTVKKSSLPSEYLLQKTLADATFEDGKYSIPVSAADLADINVGVYRYDIQINVGSVKTTIANGNFTVKTGAISADGSRVTSSISMVRGDTKILKFTRMNDQEETIVGLPTEILFSVPALGIEKTLEDMSQDVDGSFRITILPEDTDEADFGSYGFTISVTDMGITSTIAEGTLTLTEEVTFAENER